MKEQQSISPIFERQLKPLLPPSNYTPESSITFLSTSTFVHHLSNLNENIFSITLLLLMNLIKDLHSKVSMDKTKKATKDVAATLLLFCFY